MGAKSAPGCGIYLGTPEKPRSKPSRFQPWIRGVGSLQAWLYREQQISCLKLPTIPEGHPKAAWPFTGVKPGKDKDKKEAE